MLTLDIQPPSPLYPVPSPRQLRWHTHEFYGFLHFGLNTFTDKEWGYGDESPELFAPTNFDADQIASTANDVGMSGLILLVNITMDFAFGHPGIQITRLSLVLGKKVKVTW